MSSSTKALGFTAQVPPATIQTPAQHELYAIAVVKSRTVDRPDIKILGAYYKEHDAKTSLDTFKQSLAFGRDNSGNDDDRVEFGETTDEWDAMVISRSTSHDIPWHTKAESLAYRQCVNRRFIPGISTHLVVLSIETTMTFLLDTPLAQVDFPSWHFEARDANQEAFLIAMEMADSPDIDGWCDIKARYAGEQVEFCMKQSSYNSGWLPYVWILVMKVNSQSKAWGEDVWTSSMSPEEKARALCQRALETAK